MRQKRKIVNRGFSFLWLLFIVCYSTSCNFPFLNSDQSNSNNSEESEALFTPISFSFLTLGNQYNGDSIYIKAGDKDILIDAGSRQNSASVIETYIDRYCNDKKIEYVIVTHAHQDHIAAFCGDNGILAKYKVDTIIDFGETKISSGIYGKYQTARDKCVQNGSCYYSAKDCFYEQNGGKKEIALGNDLSMRILYQEAYDKVPSSSEENNNSVCLLFSQGEKKMLFTGDLEKKRCQSLLDSNEIGEVDLYKGGHHGSINANEDFFIDAIKPKTICTCCVAGSDEYTDVKENTMPYQKTINNWAKYTDDVYLTSYMKVDEDNESNVSYEPLNGDIQVSYDSLGNKSISCSVSSKKLKDTDWLKNNRSIPLEWAS